MTQYLCNTLTWGPTGGRVVQVVLFNGSSNPPFQIMGSLPGHPVVDDGIALEGVDGALIVTGASDGFLRVFQWS